MTIKDIIRMGHPTLRQVAAPYPPEIIASAEFKALVEDMQDTLAHSGGIGLAAPQIDISKQVLIIEVPDTGSRYGDTPALPFGIYVNPTIKILDPETAGFWEGCLSIPGMMGYVERAQHIVVDYLDEYAQARTLELKGFLATVFQHEFDHLNATLYPDQIKDLSLFVFEQEYLDYHQAEVL